MIKLLMIIFAIRPILDLFWNFKIGPINVAGGVALVLSLLLYFIFFIAIRKKKIFLNKVTLIFIVYCSIITLFTFDNVGDFDNLLRIVSATIFIFILPKNININQLEKIMKWFVIITLVPIVISYLQAMGVVKYNYWDYLPSGQIGRATGGYRQPSVLTRFLTFSNLYCLYFISKYKDNYKIKRKSGMYLLVSCFSIFISYHRTGYLINILIIISWFVIENRKKILKMLTIILLISVVTSGVLYIANHLKLISITFDDFKEMISLNNIISFENGSKELVLRGRGGIIENLSYSIRNSYWYYTILGNGKDMNLLSGIQMNIADMDWIRVIWNYGVIGLGLWVSQYVSFINIIIKAYRNNNNNNSLIIRVGVYSILIYIIFGLTIEATTTPNFMYHIYLIIGYIGCNKLGMDNKGDGSFEIEDKYSG